MKQDTVSFFRFAGKAHPQVEQDFIKGKQKKPPQRVAFGGDEGMLTGFIFRFAKNSGCGAPAATAQQSPGLLDFDYQIPPLHQCQRKNHPKGWLFLWRR